MAKILVADDDKTMLGLLTTLLELEGEEAISVNKPDEILPAARREKPDLILMDVYLAGENACRVLQTLKSDTQTKDIPVLMTSGMEMRDQCIRDGAEDFILKPFRPVELIERIRAIIESRVEPAP
ncbi:MAG: response regulator [Anaerolineae bacterium]